MLRKITATGASKLLLITIIAVTLATCSKKEDATPSASVIGTWKYVSYDRILCEFTSDNCTSCETCTDTCNQLVFEEPNVVKEFSYSLTPGGSLGLTLKASGTYVINGSTLTMLGDEYTFTLSATELKLKFITVSGNCTQTSHYVRI